MPAVLNRLDDVQVFIPCKLAQNDIPNCQRRRIDSGLRRVQMLEANGGSAFELVLVSSATGHFLWPSRPATLLAMLCKKTAILAGFSCSQIDLWGVPFVLVGSYLIVGRFFYEALLRSRTYYGLTNRRVIIISGMFAPSVMSLQVQTLTDVSLLVGASGVGTLMFGPNLSDSGGRRGRQPSFESIADAREVFDRICAARREE